MVRGKFTYCCCVGVHLLLRSTAMTSKMVRAQCTTAYELTNHRFVVLKTSKSNKLKKQQVDKPPRIKRPFAEDILPSNDPEPFSWGLWPTGPVLGALCFRGFEVRRDYTFFSVLESVRVAVSCIEMIDTVL